MSKPRPEIPWRPGLERLEGRALLSAAPHGSLIGFSHEVRATRYQVEVVPLNGSGVQGRGQVLERFRLDGPDAVCLKLTLSGLGSGRSHALVLNQPRVGAIGLIPPPDRSGTRVFQFQSSSLGPLADGMEPLVIQGMTVQGRYDPGLAAATVRLHQTFTVDVRP